MALSKEWIHRITHWNAALWKACYKPVEKLELSGFVTRRHLSFDQASHHKFHPMPQGTIWGAKWQYGWFTTEFSIPESVVNQRIMLHLNPAAKANDVGECLVWINGKISGSIGWARQEITLSKKAIPGDKFSILAEAYAGHGPLIVGGGPIFYGQESIPEVKDSSSCGR